MRSHLFRRADRPSTTTSRAETILDLQVTCGQDEYVHLVADEAYLAGASHGRYIARCGHAVVAASLSSEPGAPCRACCGPASGSCRALLG